MFIIIGYVYYLSLKYKKTLGTGCLAGDIPWLLVGGLNSPQLWQKPAVWEATVPQQTGGAPKRENQETLRAWGWEHFALLPTPAAMGRSHLCTGALCLIVLAPKTVSKGEQGDRAVTGEGLLVDMTAKGRLEVSLPEQDAGGAVQPALTSGQSPGVSKTSLDWAQYAMYRVITSNADLQA